MWDFSSAPAARADEIARFNQFSRHSFDPARQLVTYHAGYPFVNLERDLQKPANKQTAFQMTKGKIVAVQRSYGSLGLDNFSCPDAAVSECLPNQIPFAGFSWVIKAENLTGSGASGSLVIDENYNAIGILWGLETDGANNPTNTDGYTNFSAPFYNSAINDQALLPTNFR